MIFNRPDPSIPSWCEIGEAVKPSDEDIRIGWPDSQIPPSRQEFNWIDKRQDEGIKYLCRTGISEWREAEYYQGKGLVIGDDGSVYWNLRDCQGVNPVFDNTGCWELTNIRLRDGDRRYIAQGASMFLTQDVADGRYQLQADMANFLTYAIGDTRYALISGLGSFLTLASGDARYALRTDMSAFLSISAAAQTYLRIVDAGNLYLSSSVAAQTYLSRAEADNRFNEAHNYSEVTANNAAAGVRSWVQGILPNVTFRRFDVASGTMTGIWLIVGASPPGFEFAVGIGSCRQGDTIRIPDGFSLGNVWFNGWVKSAYGGNIPSGDSILNFTFDMGAGGTVAHCYFVKSNDGMQQRSGSVCEGSWIGIGYR